MSVGLLRVGDYPLSWQGTRFRDFYSVLECM